MSVRHLLYSIISADVGVQAVYADRIMDAGQLGDLAGQAPPFPYLVTKYGERSSSFSGTAIDVEVELWSYDDPHDYARTEAGLEALKSCLDRRANDVVAVEGVTYRLIEARYAGTSRDFQDDALRASTKYATYRLVASRQ